MKTIIAAALAALVLTGCGADTAQDRSDEAGGRAPDTVGDAYDVTLTRNIDDVPNVVTFCTTDGIKIVATRTGSTSGSTTREIEILPDAFQDCGR